MTIIREQIDSFDQTLIDQGVASGTPADVVRWDLDGDAWVTLHYYGQELQITASENGRIVRHETLPCCMQDFLSHVERLTKERGKPVWLQVRT